MKKAIKRLQILYFYLISVLDEYAPPYIIAEIKSDDLVGRFVNNPSKYSDRRIKIFDKKSLYGGKIIKIDFPYIGEYIKFNQKKKKYNDIFVYVKWVADSSNIEVAKESNSIIGESLPNDTTIEQISELQFIPGIFYSFIHILILCFSVLYLTAVVSYYIISILKFLISLG